MFDILLTIACNSSSIRFDTQSPKLPGHRRTYRVIELDHASDHGRQTVLEPTGHLVHQAQRRAQAQVVERRQKAVTVVGQRQVVQQRPGRLQMVLERGDGEGELAVIRAAIDGPGGGGQRSGRLQMVMGADRDRVVTIRFPRKRAQALEWLEPSAVIQGLHVVCRGDGMRW